MVESLCKIFCPTSVSDVSVDRMCPKELFFLRPGILHGQIFIDILLTPIHNTHETEFQWVSPARKDVKGIGTGVHKVELCENTKCAKATRVHGTGQL